MPSKFTILTAYDAAFKNVAEISCANFRAYCELHGIDFVESIIPDDYEMHPSWFKVGAIQSLITKNDFVMWIDADALILGKAHPQTLINPSSTLNISADENGINCGVMVWKNCGQSLEVLDKIYRLYPEYKDHQWWEQGALQDIIRQSVDVTRATNLVPKHVFNCYTNEIGPDTHIIHYPGFSILEKEILMKAQSIALKRNGHGYK